MITTPSQVDIHLLHLSTNRGDEAKNAAMRQPFSIECSSETVTLVLINLFHEDKLQALNLNYFLKVIHCVSSIFYKSSKILNWALSLKFHIKTKTTPVLENLHEILKC